MQAGDLEVTEGLSSSDSCPLMAVDAGSEALPIAATPLN